VRRAVDACLKAARTAGLIPFDYFIVSCPMCGRCTLDIPEMARKTGARMYRVARRWRRRGKPLERIGGLTVAVMGCSVNGPGEAKGADVGIAGGRGKTGTLFTQGRPVATLPARKLLPALEREVRRIVEERFGGV
jgi:(E)-4-hydroxy-3-methylbut-2-enyl-diphosphate synthase